MVREEIHLAWRDEVSMERQPKRATEQVPLRIRV